MTHNEHNRGEIILYQSTDGTPAIDVRLESETLWLNLNQISTLFQRDKSVISRHLKKIFDSAELERNSVVAFFATTGSDGKTYTVEFFNLDAIISVGYRVNSLRGTQFRIWANSVLKHFLVQGYALNTKRLAQAQDNFKRLETLIEVVRRSLHEGSSELHEAQTALALIHDYAQSFSILSHYDSNSLDGTGATAEHRFTLTIESARGLVAELRRELKEKNLASQLFGRERDGALESCIASIYQSFGEEELYPTVEQKAANLLYFVIKNHPFVDGNKRIASLLFIRFLECNNILYRTDGTKRIAANTLVALALMIAASNPNERDAMISVVVNLLF
jgi:prophage maintenance system killer protein